jgi:ketosteroid isomerase-like protein
MYKAIARRRSRAVFDALSRNDMDAVMRDVAEDVHHVFPGENAIGGERRGRDALQRWFDREQQLFGDVEFTVERISVKGPPWDMWVAIAWTNRGRTADGEPYANRGSHWIRLHRGKGTEILAYLDTERVTAACERMAAAGIEEAAAAPITS